MSPTLKLMNIICAMGMNLAEVESFRDTLSQVELRSFMAQIQVDLAKNT